MKDSFIIYKSYYEPIKGLSDKQLGRLFRALFCYQIEGSTQVDVDIQMAFAFFKNQMDIDQSKYQKVVDRNKLNGSKGGRPTKEEKPKNPVGLEKPKKPDNEYDNEYDNENDNEYNISPYNPPKGENEAKSKKFIPPDLEEVTAYCKERGNSVSPEKFIDHYTANGWMRGKNKIKDWRAAVRTWENKINSQNGRNQTVQGESGAPKYGSY